MTKTMPHPMTAAYNASKVALSQYSNIIRLELEPVNVRMIELVTRRVGTRLIGLSTRKDMSIYKPPEPALQIGQKKQVRSLFHRERCMSD